MTQLNETTDIVIVGAGPTGLTAAVRLAQLGVPHVVLDAAAEPSRTSKAALVHASSLEMLAELGVADGTGRRRTAAAQHRHGRPRARARPGAPHRAAHPVPVRAQRAPEHHRGLAGRAAGPARGIGAATEPGGHRARRGRPAGRRGHGRRRGVRDQGALRDRSRRRAQRRAGRGRPRLPRSDVLRAVRPRRHRARGDTAPRRPGHDRAVPAGCDGAGQAAQREPPDHRHGRRGRGRAGSPGPRLRRRPARRRAGWPPGRRPNRCGRRGSGSTTGSPTASGWAPCSSRATRRTSTARRRARA